MGEPELIVPEWPAPATVGACCSTRRGGVSAAPFDSFNLGDHVGDAPAAVAANRRALIAACPGLEAVSWLRQVHGNTPVAAATGAEPPQADAVWTAEPGLGCAVLTADCLPVLLCDRRGTRVAAVHAGWRGLCAGVIENAVAAFDTPADMLAWLGPAIGPDRFEVGPEVRAAFLAAAVAGEDVGACFRPAARAEHYLADIYALAHQRLQRAGVTAIYGGGLCTVTDADRFYSYRRDGVTGRMASLIYIMSAEPDY